MPGEAEIARHTHDLLKQLRSKLDTELTRHLFDIIDTRRIEDGVSPTEKERLRGQVERLAARTLRDEWRRMLTPEQRGRMVDELVEETLGFGPLEVLLRDPSVSEIMVNGPSRIFVERHGRIEPTDLKFRDDDHLMGIIERMLSAVGRRVSQAEPYVDARLPQGYRVNVAVPPVSLEGPAITIRKFAREFLSIDQLIRLGTITREVAELLRLCVLGRLNILISGPASSGKTTMMNVLAKAVPYTQRIVIIEEVAELQLSHRHVVRLEMRPPNLEGRRQVTVRELLKNALHMRPDRILVGEIRGDEALDMLQAMNVGHDGSMTTLHANSPADVLTRITTMALLFKGELTPAAITWQFHAVVDLIVQLDRFGDGSRKVTNVTEVRRDPDREALVDLFTLTEREPGSWSLVPTGVRPMFLERLMRRGVHVPEYLFSDGWQQSS